MMHSDAAEPLYVVEPKRGALRLVDLGEFWRAHELLYFLIWRDVKVRYKQAVLGTAWAVIQPLFITIIFTIFFGRMAKLPSDGVPYALFSYAAMLPWTYFSSALTRGISSLVSSGNLLSKVYFSRLVIPVAAVTSGVVDYAISLTLFVPILLFYGYYPTWAWLWGIPLLTVLSMGLVLGISLWLGALNVRFRDVSYIVPFLMQLWMFASPIVYSTSMIPEKYYWLSVLNPLTGIIAGFRAILLGLPIDTIAIGCAAVVTVVSLVTGSWYFAKTERGFADAV